MAARKRARWRVQSNDAGDFDELVVHYGGKEGCLIHAEMMTDRSIFVSIGPLSVWAYVDAKGVAHVSGTENRASAAPAPGKENEGT